jgi:SAM-dependent methyltransferase
MPIFRRIFFNWMYLKQPPWDTGISPPELMTFIGAHKPGYALDLGCGTGTNAITLARHGWHVTGVDFARRGIRIARDKAAKAGVSIDFKIADVTRLDDLEGQFDLILDIGCFHGLSEAGKKIYVENLERLMAPQGSFLMYGFFESTGDGVKPEDLNVFEPGGLELIHRKDGFDRGSRPSAWVEYKRKPSELQPLRSYDNQLSSRR